jgi:hypothetical protein
MSDLALDTFGEVDFSQKGPYFIHGADAVAQHLRIRLRFYLGEWFLDTRVGIPFYTQIFSCRPLVSRSLNGSTWRWILLHDN